MPSGPRSIASTLPSKPPAPSPRFAFASIAGPASVSAPCPSIRFASISMANRHSFTPSTSCSATIAGPSCFAIPGPSSASAPSSSFPTLCAPSASPTRKASSPTPTALSPLTACCRNTSPSPKNSSSSISAAWTPCAPPIFRTASRSSSSSRRLSAPTAMRSSKPASARAPCASAAPPLSTSSPIPPNPSRWSRPATSIPSRLISATAARSKSSPSTKSSALTKKPARPSSSNPSSPSAMAPARRNPPSGTPSAEIGTLALRSVDEVLCTYEKTGETVKFEPFFSFRHGSRQKEPTFWNAVRRQSGPDGGDSTQVFLSLVDLTGRPISFDLDTLTMRCTCSNGELPSRLPFGEENGDFDLEGGSAIERIVALRKPTPTLRPAVGRDALWRLISHLSLNYLSLVEGGREALQEILRLYQGSSPQLEQQVEGIVGVSSERRRCLRPAVRVEIGRAHV